MDILLEPGGITEPDDEALLLINGIDSPGHALIPFFEDKRGFQHRNTIIVSGDPGNVRYRESANVVVLPCSFAALQVACGTGLSDLWSRPHHTCPSS